MILSYKIGCEWLWMLFWNAIWSQFVLLMTNRKWVPLDTFLKGNLNLNLITSNSWWVIVDIVLKGKLIISHPMTNSWWATLDTFLKGNLRILFKYCAMKQDVSDNNWSFFWKAIWSHHVLWLTGCEWHWTFVPKGYLITSGPMTNRTWKWVTLDTSGNLITSCHMKQDVSDIGHFAERQSNYIMSCNQ